MKCINKPKAILLARVAVVKFFFARKSLFSSTLFAFLVSFFVGYESSFELLLVALPRIECASKPRVIWGLATRDSAKLISARKCISDYKIGSCCFDTIWCLFLDYVE